MDEFETGDLSGTIGPDKPSFFSESPTIDDPSMVSHLQEGEKDSEEDTSEENLEYGGLVSHVNSQYNRSRDARRQEEERWLECYRNFRGEYGPDTQFTSTEKSRAFIKITKTKVLAAYSKLTEVLFSSKKFPIGVEPTKIPSGIPEMVHFEVGEKTKGGPAKKSPLPSTMSRPEIAKAVKNIKELQDLPEEVEVKEGAGTSAKSYTYEPAAIAASKMEKKMLDQLEEANAVSAVRSFCFEMALFGTGIMKGPLVSSKEYPKWDEKGNYKPDIKTIADIEHSSIWNNYPDPEARSATDFEFWIERHRMSESKLRRLKKRPFFRSNSINLAIDAGANYVDEYWEHTLRDNKYDSDSSTRYEVLEYWGVIDKELVEETEFYQTLSDFEKDLDQYNVNIWICNGQILRLVLNPFNPTRIPYYACPYESNPYSMFGIGVAENMLDTQLIMNGFFRLAIDNAVISSNVVFEIDETNLAPGQNMDIYPGKVFRRQGGAPGQSLYATKYPNVTQECMLLFDKARQLSDEATGIPSYAHGISGIMSTGRTASGMSMLMGAADENIKTVVRNIDDYLLVPLGKNLFAFNMQFDFDESIKGDLDIVALGTESLMRNEVRSQKLLQFLQLTTNESDMPFVKRDYLLRELAQTLDLDPEKVINDPRAAAIQAASIKKMRDDMGISDQPPQQPGNIQGMPNGSGMTSATQAPAGMESAAPQTEQFSGNLDAGGIVSGQ